MKNFKNTLIAAILGSAITIGGFKLFELDKKNVINQTQANYQALQTGYRDNTLSSGNQTQANYQALQAGYKGNTLSSDFVDFSDPAAKVTPSVVHIKSTIRNTKSRGQSDIPDMFREFFGDQFEQQGVRQSSGSGVIINSDGYIVTNYHVINNASELEVTLYDKRTYNAKVIGTDPSTDLALIKIEQKGLPKIEYGNSDLMKVGQWALAVGNPFNLSSTVTAGIISAKGRNINILKENAAIESFIQTDAAVNPGNSGGALVNLKGELIGINTAIASNTGSYTGYSFAVPVNIMSKVVEDLLEYGKVQRAFIGINIKNLDGKLAKELSVNVTQGVYVIGLMENGAAEHAGMQEGDIIVKVDGKKIKSVPELQEIIGRHRPSDEVILEVNRDGNIIEVLIQLKNREGNTNIIKRRNSKVLNALGASFEELDKDEKDKLGIAYGVKITELRLGKLRNQTDVERGFIIIKVNKQIVNSIDELNKLLNEAQGGVLMEGIYPDRNGSYFYGFGL